MAKKNSVSKERANEKGSFKGAANKAPGTDKSVLRKRATTKGRGAEANSSTYILRGSVLYDTGLVAAGLKVLAIDHDTGGENALGQALSDAAGDFRIEYSDTDFRRSSSERRGADIFVIVQTTDGRELARTPTKRNAPRDFVLNITVHAESFVVHGTITDAAGMPAAGAAVRAFDVDLRAEEQLGNAKTGHDGTYRIAYTRARFQRAEKGSPDLRVCVMDDDEHESATSAIWFKAPADAEVNLQLAADKPTCSELERLLAAIVPLLKGQGPNKSELALPALEARDVAFLVKETDEPEDLIRVLVAAAQATASVSAKPTPQVGTHAMAWSSQGIPLSAFYAWCKRWPGLAAASLLARSSEELLSALEEAIARAEIRALTDTERERLRAAIATFQRREALGRSGEQEHARLGDYLAIAAEDRPEWTERLGLKSAALYEHLKTADLSASSALDEVATVVDDPVLAARVFAALRLGRLTGDHGTLTAVLQGKVLQTDAPAAAPEAALASMDRVQWIQLAAAHGVPPTRALSVEEYAEELQVKVEQAAPVAVLSHVLATAPWFAEQRDPQAAPFKALIQALRRSPEADLLGKTAKELAEEMRLDDDAKHALGTLQNLKRVDVRWEEVPHLIERNIDSPADIMHLGEQGLKAHLRDAIPERRIEEIWNRTSATAVGFLGVHAMLSQYVNGAPSPVMHTRSSKVVQDLFKANPSLATLFGSLDQCACDPCLSVLSPAAYLADLLAYIDGQGASAVRRLLEARRPDIYHLKLSCENSEIEVAHIDLVNEILEGAIAFPRRAALSAGTTITQPASTAPTAAVQSELAATVTGPLGALTAVRQPARPGDLYGVTYWTISDRFRQWSLTGEEEYFGFEPMTGAGLGWTAAERDTLIQALDDNRLDAQMLRDPRIQRAFRHAMSLPNLPLNVTDASIEGRGAADGVTRWEIRLAAAGRVTVVPGSGAVGAVMLASLGTSGQSLSFQLQNRQAPAIAAELAAGRFPNLLLTLCNEHSKVKIRVQSDGANTWRYAVERPVTMVYRQAGIWIRGLCYQSSDSSRDLLLEPQNRNPLAYAHLNNPDAVYPWSLPYDARLQELRALLHAAHLPRIGWLTAGRRWDDRLENIVILRERLGMSSQELQLIEGSATASLESCWGFQQASLLGDLRNVGTLLKQSKLAYNELIELLGSAVVNPAGAVGISLPPDCKLENANLSGVADNAVFHAFLGRLHRFGRLSRKLALPIALLDRALLRADAAQPLGSSSLQGLSHLLAVANSVNTGLDKVLDWFDHGPESLRRALSMDGDEFDSAVLVLARAGAPFKVVAPLDSPRELHRFITEIEHAQRHGQSWAELAYALHHAGPQWAVLDWPQQERLHWLKNLHVELAASLPAGTPTYDERDELAKAVLAKLAQVLKADEAVVSILGEMPLHADTAGAPAFFQKLVDWLLAPLPADNAASQLRTDCNACLLRLHKLVMLSKTWRAGAEHLGWLQSNTAGANYTVIKPVRDLAWAGGGAIGTSRSSYGAWKRTTALVTLARIGPGMATVLESYRTAGADVTGQPARYPRWSVLQEAFRLGDVDTVRAVAGALGDAPNRRLDPLWLGDLCGALALLQKTGLSAVQFAALTADAATDIALAATRTLLARLGDSARKDALRRVQDALREERRDRLTDFLLWRDKLADSNALYARYLIDPQMSACMNTTRMLQSTAAVQLFVQRCLLNLEKDAAPDGFDTGRWQWMSAYRIWEANRKVFLYPENWLYPELRDDQTETFRSFIQSINGGELRADSAHDNASEYLSALESLSSIAIRGLFEYSGLASSREARRLLVIGRLDSADTYFWRECVDWRSHSARWTGWESTQTGGLGDYVIPFAMKGRPCVAWPSISKIGGSNGDADEWKVQFQWVALSRAPSLPHKVPGTLQAPVVPDKDLGTSFFFRALVSGEVHALPATECTPRRERVDISCYCIPPSIPSDAGTQLPYFIGYVGSKYKTLSASEFAEAWIEVEVRCSINYRDGTVPQSGVLVHLSLERVFNEYLNREEVVSASNSTVSATTNTDGVCVVNLNLTPSITNWVSWPYRLGLRVSTGSPADLQETDITSEVFSQQLERLGDQQRPAAITLRYICRMVKQMPQNQPVMPVPASVRMRMARFGTVRIDDDSIHETVFQDGKLQTIVGVLPGTAGYLRNGIMRDEDAHSHPLVVARQLPPVWNRWDFGAVTGDTSEVVVGGTDRAKFPTGIDSETWHFDDSVSSYYIGLDVATDHWTVISNSRPSADITYAGSCEEWIALQQRTDINQSRRQGQRFLDYLPTRLSSLSDYSITTQAVHFEAPAPDCVYNWEVFCHVPLLLAVSLSRQHRFADARRWFHYIFDPTTGETGGGRSRYWKFLPFRHREEPPTITEWLQWAANPTVSSPLKGLVQSQIAAWADDPFNPFAVARLRPAAFEWFTVMAYVRNLLDWGDQLFRRETRESIAEAVQLYVLAEEILGPRPRQISVRRTGVSGGNASAAMSYRELEQFGPGRISTDTFGNAWIGALDDKQIKDAVNQLTQRVHDDASWIAFWEMWSKLASIGSLYFCVPPNEKLLELWDRVEARLFNIRHCRNIDGVEWPLPLYEPPIDPELLIRARAAGLDLADALSERFAQVGPYRFHVWLQKANDFCNEVKGLGAALLGAVEKKEGEHLSLLRSQQEIAMLRLVEAVKSEQIKEAQANIEALEKTRRNAVDRFTYLQRQLGNTELQFDAAGVPVVTQGLIASVRESEMPDDFRGLALIQPEIDQVWRLQEGHVETLVSGLLKLASGIAHTASAINVVADPTEKSAKVTTAWGYGFSAAGDAAAMLASNSSFWERRAGLIGGWQRRRDEWVQQSKMTAEEIRQIDKQLLALEIRKVIAEKELENHRKQIESAGNVDDYLRHLKFSGEALYGWMESQLASVYFGAYQMAVDLARRAERALQHELGDESLRFIQFGHWDSLRKGLLSGERLSQDLRRMEAHWYTRNERELEITKHISLRQLDPEALMRLRATGQCQFSVPEWLFDLDFPGHYFRRIKSVSISVPAVVGPYTGVAGTLTLQSSKTRYSNLAGGAYDDAARYRISRLPIEAIATSSGQNDSGLFELNFRDERYLPFEGAGAISDWKFTLPAEFRAFDYDTISDVIVHLRYTARNGGQSLADAANTSLDALLQSSTDGPMHQLLSLRRDFSTQWQHYRSAPAAGLTIELTEDHFSYLTRSRIKLAATARLAWVASDTSGNTYAESDVQLSAVTLPLSLTLSNSQIESDDPYLIVGYMLKGAR